MAAADPKLAALRAEVGASSSDDGVLQRCLDLAIILVEHHIADSTTGDETPIEIPEAVLERAIMVTAAEAFAQRNAPNGVLNQQFTSSDGDTSSIPVRISADPMRPAYPLLEKFLIPVVGG